MSTSPVRRSTRVRRPTLRQGETEGSGNQLQVKEANEQQARNEQEKEDEDEVGESPDEKEKSENEEGDDQDSDGDASVKEEEEEEEDGEEKGEAEIEERKSGVGTQEEELDDSSFESSRWASLKSEFESTVKTRNDALDVLKFILICSGMLLNRTLYIHTLSPLHLPRRPSPDQAIAGLRGKREMGKRVTVANPVLTKTRLDVIAQELKSYLSIRFNDSLLLAPMGEGGSSRRAEGLGADRLKSVQAGFLAMEEQDPLRSYLSTLDQRSDPDEDYEDAGTSVEESTKKPRRRLAWAIEIQIKAAPVFLPSGRMRNRSVEFAHLIFLPGLRKNHYPVVLSKAPSAAALSPTVTDDVDGPATAATATIASSLTARAIISYAFEYLTKRFDCRLTSSYGLLSLRGPNLVRLADAILGPGSTYTEIQRRRDEIDEEDRPSPPVELTFAMPNHVQVGEEEDDDDDYINADAEKDRGKRKRGPNPRLATLSFTVPWRICKHLLQVSESIENDAGTPRKRPELLPALAQYLEAHASIRMDQLSLVKFSIAGVTIGSSSGGGGGGGLTSIASTEAARARKRAAMSFSTFTEVTRSTATSGAASSTTGASATSGVRLKIAPLKMPDIASSFALDDRPGGRRAVPVKDTDSWRIQDVLVELLDVAVRESW